MRQVVDFDEVEGVMSRIMGENEDEDEREDAADV